MNSFTFCVGYVLAVVMVRVSNADFDAFSGKNTTHDSPFNFMYKWNDFLVMEIKLKNIPRSVTAVYVIYSFKKDFYQKKPESAPEREKDPDEIKNGQVKINIQRSLNLSNIFYDVELQTKDGLCQTSRVAEGRWGSSQSYYQDGNSYIYWNTGWKHDDTKSCLLPNRCEIVMDFKNLCQENINCNVEADKYICTFQTKNLKSFFYQTYDTDEPSTKATFRDDYTYLEAVDSFYKLHKKSKSWFDAKDVCAQEGAVLFFPENSDEVDAVMSFWNPKPNDYLWVGISDLKTEGVFVTVDGRLISEVYEKWHPGQPDNYQNLEHCLNIFKDSGYIDIACHAQWCSFICKRSLLQNIQLDLSSIIGPPLNSSAMNTKLIFELELFDNNTSVHVATPTSKKIQRSDKLILTGDDVVKEYIVSSQVYSESTEVKFSCEEYKDRSTYNYVALINETKKKMQTFNETQNIRRKFKKADSGSMLCCLYYVYEPSNDGKELRIKRFVVKKTSMIYKPEVPISPNSAEPPFVVERTTSTTRVTPVTDGGSFNTTIITSTGIKFTANCTKADTSSYTITIVIISTIFGTFLAQLIALAIWKCRWIKRRPRGAPASAMRPITEPFYLNMLFRRECDEEIGQIDQHQYEEIVPQDHAGKRVLERS